MSPLNRLVPTPDLPNPDPAELAHSERLATLILQELEGNNGYMAFDRFMELALYAPGLGYYSGGSLKFGEEGDFITAPEVSPLFGRCLAMQCQQILSSLGGGDILEFGAGSGRLAIDLLKQLHELECLPGHYLVLEVSSELRQRQQRAVSEAAPELYRRMRWLDRPPVGGFRGIILANEVLDSMPVHRFRMGDHGIEEIFVRSRQGTFAPFTAPPRSPGLAIGVQGLLDRGRDLASGYTSEINLRLGPWIRMLADFMDSGLVLLIDYGYPAEEYYHPQRTDGTLMCHYRHRAHDDPFRWVGIQDITTQVDFTAAADAGRNAGFQVTGFSPQAHFLLGCGLDRMVAASDPDNIRTHLELVSGVKRLTLPSEMGERFKVLALTKRLESDLLGFSMRNQIGRL